MLADATRVQVLWSLADREMSVNELAKHVGKPAPSVSQHLAKLRMARLVRLSLEVNGGICRSLLINRYGLAIDDPEEVVR